MATHMIEDSSISKELMDRHTSRRDSDDSSPVRAVHDRVVRTDPGQVVVDPGHDCHHGVHFRGRHEADSDG